MPFCCRLHYGLKIVTIIDYFEIFIEKPFKLLMQEHVLDLSANITIHQIFLISATPQGVIYISNSTVVLCI